MRKRGVGEVVLETYKDFAENTSVQGLKYTVKSKTNTFERCIWLAIVACGLIISVYMVNLFWTRFSSNPTLTVFQNTFAPTTIVPFPAVTICNVNQILESKVEKFVDKLQLHGAAKEEVMRAFPQLTYFIDDTNNRNQNVTRLTFLRKILELNNQMNLSSIFKEVSQSCDEMLKKCRWEDVAHNCSALFVESFTPYGICCSFNYNLKKKGEEIYTFFTGFDMGLTVLIDPMLKNSRNSIGYSRGVNVLIHNHRDYPSSASLSKILGVGRQTLLSISASKLICGEDLKILAKAQRKCLFPDEKALKFFDEYSDINCVTECNIFDVYKQCGCIHYYHSFTGKPECGVPNISCLSQFNYSSKVSENNCDCPAQCEDVIYSVTSASTKFADQQYTTYDFLKGENLTSQILMHAYFGSETQTILRREMLTSTTYLLASFGGVFSLFLGCSFITAVEIIYYVFVRFLINWKVLKPRQNKIAPAVERRRRTRRMIFEANENFVRRRDLTRSGSSSGRY